MDTHSKFVGYLLWIFGFTGSHRFYFGKPISGTIWLCTGGLFLIGWLVDIFLIPGMDREADRRFTPGTANYTIAWILLTFFGYLGLQRFYLGKISGIVILISTLLAAVFPPFALISLIFIVVDFWTLNDQVSAKNRSR
jgi:TM2 domain-containing membrane protein YozV